MTIASHPADVRTIVYRTLLEYGLTEEELADLGETILIDEGRYTARTYRAGNLFAMWLVEVGLVQFYDPDGALLRTVNLFEELLPLRMAS
jgi:hypothetical protein